MRRQFTITSHQLDKLNKVQQVLQELQEYKPLTLRQIYYQLVGKGYIPNVKSQYTMLSNLLKWARIDGLISWDDIEDRVRVYHDLTGWKTKEDFVSYEAKWFLSGYRRNLIQTQEKYLECWIEKDALSGIFTRVAKNYTVPVVVCRGFSSVSFLHGFKERLDSQKDKKAVMLYFGDFDPSGVEMLNAMETTLEDEMDVYGVEFKRVALLEENIAKYKLPHNPDAIKKSDTRTEKHLLTYGDLAVELDALRPDLLEKRVKDAIEAELDMNLFLQEQNQYLTDLDDIRDIKTRVSEFINSQSMSEGSGA